MLDSTNQVTETKVGMLFLFDVVNSSGIASKEEQLGNAIFYEMIKVITNNIVKEINSKYKNEVIIIQNTGDGYYLFSQEVDVAIYLWILLVRQFSHLNISIHCGASYGHVQINGENTGSHLGNIVARCCSFGVDPGELVITEGLYDLIKDCSYYRSIAPKEIKVDNPNLKGCEDIHRIYKLKRNEGRQTQTKQNKIRTDTSFFGRDDILRECTQFASECFSLNQAFSIIGVSGVGKTTLAMSSSALLNFNPICIDLRQIDSLRNLHRLIIDVLFEELSNYNLADEVFFNGKITLLNIFSQIKNIVLVFDHAELLMEDARRYSELLDFFPALHDSHVYIILTSTHLLSIDSLTIKTWNLRNPTDDEKLCMLSHWIKVKKLTWLESLATHIANHSYLICLVGQQFQGSYKLKKDILSIQQQIEGASDVSNYLIHILKQLPLEIRFWAYLAYLCNGSIYTKAIPKTTLDAYFDRGLVKEIGETTVFHPLVMRAVDEERNIIDFREISYSMLSNIQDDKCSTLIEYYKYLCLEHTDSIGKKFSLTSNWQTWSEEIDSYKVQALIEQLKNQLDIDSETAILDLFSSIIYIFQGKREDLEIASRKCKSLAENENVPLCIRLLSKIESIECQRKLKGPSYAVSLIYDNISLFNETITKIQSESYCYYGKYYYLGTFFFLIGNILRSLEDHENAIVAYKVSLGFINREDPVFRNAQLQKVHISYGIAESYLKSGQFNLAIEFAEETIRTTHSIAKFGIALLYLLKARAYLCEDFSNKDNYENALKSVKKSQALFSDIRFPNYILRCDFVEAAIYMKKRKRANARKKLVEMNEHLPGNDDMSYRVEILLSKILGIKGRITPDMVNAITQRKGRQIGLFFKNQSDIVYDVCHNQQIQTIKVVNDRLIEESFFINAHDLKNDLWLVD